MLAETMQAIERNQEVLGENQEWISSTTKKVICFCLLFTIGGGLIYVGLEYDWSSMAIVLGWTVVGVGGVAILASLISLKHLCC